MNHEPPSTARLAVESLNHFTGLFRSEIALARAKFAEKLGQAVTGAASLIVAGILLIPVVVVALIALAAWLMELGLRASLAHGAAALVGLVLVGGLAFFGKGKMSSKNLVPSRTLHEVERDLDATKRVL